MTDILCFYTVFVIYSLSFLDKKTELYIILMFCYLLGSTQLPTTQRRWRKQLIFHTRGIYLEKNEE